MPVGINQPAYNDSGNGFMPPTQNNEADSIISSTQPEGTSSLGIMAPQSNSGIRVEPATMGVQPGVNAIGAPTYQQYINMVNAGKLGGTGTSAASQLGSAGMGAALKYGANNVASGLKGLFSNTCTGVPSSAGSVTNMFDPGGAGVSATDLSSQAANAAGSGVTNAAEAGGASAADGSGVLGSGLGSSSDVASEGITSGTDANLIDPLIDGGVSGSAGVDALSGATGDVADAAASDALAAGGEDVASTAAADAGEGLAADAAGDFVPFLGVGLGLANAGNDFSNGNIIMGVVDVIGAIASAFGWVICTELMRQGRMPKKFWYSGSKVFAQHSDFVKRGYYIWSIPSVKHLRKHPNSLYSKFLEKTLNWRGEYLAAKAGAKGARKLFRGFLMVHSYWAVCAFLAVTVCPFIKNRDFNELYEAA